MIHTFQELAGVDSRVITRQTSIYPCLRYYVETKGSQSTERPRGSSTRTAASPTLTLTPSCKRGQKNFFHDI